MITRRKGKSVISPLDLPSGEQPHFAMERSTMLLMGKLTISMAMFHGFLLVSMAIFHSFLYLHQMVNSFYSPRPKKSGGIGLFGRRSCSACLERPSAPRWWPAKMWFFSLEPKPKLPTSLRISEDFFYGAKNGGYTTNHGDITWYKYIIYKIIHIYIYT